MAARRAAVGTPEGGDTTPDIALVERVVMHQLQQLWATVTSDEPRFDAFIGVWLTNLDLSTGESRVLELLKRDGSGQ